MVLSNPDKRNALTKGAWARLAEVMEELSLADDLRCIVIRGAGDEAFAAGADISEFPTERSNAEQARAYGKVVARAIKAIIECRHPTVAMIKGPCVGGGLELACACDLRISGESGRFGIPIKRLGHPLAYPAMKVVRDLVGRSVVLEILLEGRIFDAHEAERKGLVSRVVADDKVEEEAYATARRIASGAPLAARLNKKFAYRLADPAPLTPTELEEAYTACDSEDYRAGLQAFFDKRKPVFRGR